MFEVTCGLGDDSFNTPSCIVKPTVMSILSKINSGVAFDISKNHTGVFVYRDNKVERYGFLIEEEYDKNDYMAEAKMRLWFKNKLRELFKGQHFDFCIIEDCYGGENFDTTRKLLALNCVFDELVLEGEVTVSNFYRFVETKWIRFLRRIIKIGKGLNPKYECQKILEYLEDDFYLENCSKTESEKESMFFEDICDATGQLLGLVMYLNSEEKDIKKSSLKVSNIKMYFFENSDDMYFSNDKVIDNFEYKDIKLNTRKLEGSILDAVESNKDKVLGVCLATSELGAFGVKHNFTFYSQGYGYLIFYNKDLLKLLNKSK